MHSSPLAVRLLRTLAGDSAAARLVARTSGEIASLFDREWYLTTYPDVSSSGYDPLVHYVIFGAAESRNPHPLFDAPFYCREHPEAAANPLAHYLREGAPQRYATHPERGFCLIPPLGRPLRLLTLLVRYGTGKYPGADARLENLLNRTLPGAERRTVIIDNALPEGTERRLDEHSTLIGGDNTAWEFSAWDRGLAFVGPDLTGFDFVHFATDAFEQFGADFPERVNARMLEALRFGPAIAGHIDALNEPAGFEDHPVQAWIRSSFFFLRPAEVQALGSMVSVRDRSVLFTGDPANPFRPGSPVSEKMARFLTDWLTGDGLGQGVKWHSRFDLTSVTLPLFEAKITAILNELLLSWRLESMGCWLADVNWVQGALEGSVPGRLFEESWSNQARNRP